MATITTRVDDNIKKDFLIFCDRLGITPSSLINMFAKACIREQKIPFETCILNREAKRSIELFSEAEDRLKGMRSVIGEKDLYEEMMNDRRKRFGYGKTVSTS